jgi:hypothetical protein
MIVGGRIVRRARVWALPLLALTLLAALMSDGPDVVQATHLCGNTGSTAGPFSFETYEAADYRYTYGGSLELAGFNQLFPEQPSFALPALETGDRAAGSSILTDPYIPPVLLKAIAWIESGWAQASYDPLVQYGEVGPALVSHDCGYGIMQVTSGMQNVTGVPNLEQAMIGGHYAFNIARGARILADKWNAAPEYRPQVGSRDPKIIENWYFALWSYNGFAFKNHPLNPAYNSSRPPYDCAGGDRSAYPYQELVLGCVANPPSRAGVRLWDPVEVHLPDMNDPQFSGPLSTANWDACAFELWCAPMDIPTPNSFHTDPTGLGVARSQVIGEPVLQVSQDRFDFGPFPPGGGGNGSFTVSNAGSGLLAWRATSSASWLKVSRYAGVALGGELGGYSLGIGLSVDSASLGPGDHEASVLLESMHASGAPRVVTVSVHVGCGGADGINAIDALQILRQVAGLPACVVEVADANCSGQVDAVDALAVLRYVAGLPAGVPPGCGPLG